MRNLKRILPLAAAIAFTGLAASAANAQGGGPPGGGPGGGGGGMAGFMASLPPAAQAKIKAWQKFGENHKNYRQINASARAITEMDKDAKTKLTKDQAKKIWAAVGPWTSKPTMTDSQAQAVNKQITGALNETQIKKMAALQGEWRNRFGGGGGGRPGGGGPGGGGGFGGPGGGGGGRPGGGAPGGGGPGGGQRPDFSKMPDPKEYNPLNVNSYPAGGFGGGRGGGQGKQRMEDFIKLVKSRAA